MTSDLNVGVVGMGLMGHRHATIYEQLHGVRLAGIADVNSVKRRSAAERFNVPAHDDARDLFRLDGLDAVSICLPDNVHRDSTVAACEAGLHVLLEKPLATSVIDGENIVQAAERRGRFFMVGHLLRFDPRYDLARQSFQRGEIGHLAHITARRNSAVGAAERYGSATDLVWHVAIHDVDVIRWVTGREVVHVSARASNRRLGGIGHLDSLLIQLVLDDDTPCLVESCWILPSHYRSGIDSQLAIVGTSGVLEVTGLDQGLRVANDNDHWYPDTTRYIELADGTVGGILKTEVEHFIASVRAGRPPMVSGAEGLAAVRIAAAITESVSTGHPVNL